MPLAMQMSYGIHEQPGNPHSPVALIIMLDMTRAAADGNWIAWHVDMITIYQFAPDGSVVATWSQSNPPIETNDGRWWIQHADAESPLQSEFMQPPRLAGTAIPNVSGPPVLVYDMEGLPYAPEPPPTPPPYELTARMNWYFMRAGDLEPLSQGDDEPTEGNPPQPD